MITISLCMIVKNEEAVLSRCLDSIVDLMDEIIIVDTGSTDRTKKIAAKYTDKIYDFAWNSDFSAARNFSFSKASMDYIYVADADEVLDTPNHQKFSLLKRALLPEIEIVQMKYVTKNEYNTVLNFSDECRPKLFKRLREFVWIDPIHETVRTEPLVFNSDIEIMHLPQGLHSKRDFMGFLFAYKRDGYLSGKLHRMYARELLMTVDMQDFTDALPIFLHTITDPGASEDMQKEAACVLAHAYRIIGDTKEFFKYSLKDITLNPCSEMCYELGEFYFQAKDYNEAVIWYYNAAYETNPVLNIHTHGDLPLERLAACYEKLAASLLNGNDAHFSKLYQDYTAKSMEYRHLSEIWTLPSEEEFL